MSTIRSGWRWRRTSTGGSWRRCTMSTSGSRSASTSSSSTRRQLGRALGQAHQRKLQKLQARARGPDARRQAQQAGGGAGAPAAHLDGPEQAARHGDQPAEDHHRLARRQGHVPGVRGHLVQRDGAAALRRPGQGGQAKLRPVHRARQRAWRAQPAGALGGPQPPALRRAVGHRQGHQRVDRRHARRQGVPIDITRRRSTRRTTTTPTATLGARVCAQEGRIWVSRTPRSATSKWPAPGPAAARCLRICCCASRVGARQPPAVAGPWRRATGPSARTGRCCSTSSTPCAPRSTPSGRTSCASSSRRTARAAMRPRSRPPS